MPAYTQQALSFGAFTLHRSERLLVEGGRPVRLGERTLDLLIALVERAGEVVSKQALIAYVWGTDAVEETTLRAQVAALRTVLGEGHDGQRYIVSVAGRGYCFVAEVRLHVTPPPQPPEVQGGGLPQHNLPDPLTRVIGRNETVQAIMQRMGQHRFICIAGPAGMGKTTVAIAVAERLLPRYRDGVRFVDLSLIQEPGQVATAMAGAADLVVGASPDLQALARCFADQSLLIVLDNCEHVAEAAAEVAIAILKSAPDVHVLATSREPLRAKGEWVQRLAALDAPAEGSRLTVDEALSFPAVRLFVERSMAHVDSFALTERDVEWVCIVCRRLDGMPLALELAAGRMAAFGLRGLIRALDDRLNLLASRQRTGHSRHRTLQALLDWSFDLLPELEQLIFRRLAVFRGTFSLQAAQNVAGGPGLEGPRVVEAIASLAAKSLLSAEFGQKDVLYRMLETTRSYAHQKLEASGEAFAIHQQHALALCEWLDGGGHLETDADGTRGIGAHASLIGDVRAALDWCLGATGDPSVGVRLAAAVIPMCQRLSLQEEFRDRVREALGRIQEVHPPAPWLALRLHMAYAEMVHQTLGPVEAMRASAEAAWQLGDTPALAHHRSDALVSACHSALACGDYAASMQCANTLAELAVETPRPMLARVVDRLRAQAHHGLGHHERARQLAERVIHHPAQFSRLPVLLPVGLDQKVSMRMVLARVHWLQGRADQATVLAKECVDLAESETPALLCEALALAAGPIALWRDDRATAGRSIERLLRLSTERNLGHYQRWGRNLRRVLALRESPSGHRDGVSLDPLEVDAHDHVQRELFGTFGTFGTLGDLGALGTFGGLRTALRAGWSVPETLRQHGEWLLQQEPPDTTGAKALFEQAVALARAQGAVAWELRACMSLVRWHHGTRANEGRRGPDLTGEAAEDTEATEAKSVLADIHSRFTEGFETADWIQAKRLLEQP